METHRYYVNGRWISPRQFRKSLLIDPATEEISGDVPLAGTTEVAQAVTAARNAFDGGWHQSTAIDRLPILESLIAEIDRRRDDFADVISQEIGAPIDFARTHHIDAALNHLRATLAAAKDDRPDHPITADRPADRIRYEPMGVAALITPWNWPLNQVALKVGAALAAGCTMVLKPSEHAPRSGLLFAECMAGTGAPAGVFNMINGDGEAGESLSSDPRVDMVSFTGSTRAGRAVGLAAAQHFKRVTLELGGKSPNLLFSDCDLETVVRQGVAHCFRNAGQSCNAASRMLVEQSVYERTVTLAKQAAEETSVKLPRASGLHLGPQVNIRQFERVQGYIQTGLDEGARLVAGGPGRVGGLDKGFFSRPTVFADVTPEMTIFREEIFGPVLTITPFRDEAEAIHLANDTEYGLAAYVQTRDMDRADRVSRLLRAGMIQVNGESRAPGAPFGGVKASGLGREAGIWGIRAFQDIKSISGVRARSGT